MGDTKTAKMDSLKVLDPKRPIREADIMSQAPGFPCASLNGTGTGGGA